MKCVYKYPVPLQEEFTIVMPAGAQALHVADQHGKLCMWALVTPGADPTPTRFCCLATGPAHDLIPPVGRHISTVLCNGGLLVWHFFEAAA